MGDAFGCCVEFIDNNTHVYTCDGVPKKVRDYIERHSIQKEEKLLDS